MKFRILSMFICTLLLSGCWDSRNIEELSLIIGVGLDKPDDKNLELTQQILVPKKSAPKKALHLIRHSLQSQRVKLSIK